MLSTSKSEPSISKPKAVRGSIFYLTDDPGSQSDPFGCYEYYEDGILVLRDDGHILDVGPSAQITVKHRLLANEIADFSGRLVIPGFIDTHIHYPQAEIIAAYGEQLVHWLEKYAYPTESRFADRSYAQAVSRFFLHELLRNGTTTALIFGSVHRSSIDALFREAEKLNLRIIGGKVMMDRNAPEHLLDTAETTNADNEALIATWHNKGRIQYAITPRFAITSSPAQLIVAAKLYHARDDLYLHTHVAENLNEIALTQQLYPSAKSYLHVYDDFGLVGSRSLFAHGIHLTDDDFGLLAEKQAALSFCPTSNLFLGSGLFNFSKACKKNILLGIGTDIGAGTSFSMFQTMNEAYKVVQLQRSSHHQTQTDSETHLTPFKAFYLATLGAARALYLDNMLGSFQPGKEGDFIILNLEATPLLKFRMLHTQSLSERLFVLMMLADDRVVDAVYIMGRYWYGHSADAAI
ncbi:guanine deaminase [Nitrosomonas marina]|uniref:Guanine deaminase n=1 Tax=Nitrosomonas marina TaxID=917 RepID=A0A1H8FY44_9PROT|nr:guanine deaminase [Nitrosomonas marina]SEN36751.1 guanine deaminase [Nitrosomonas marina]